MCETLPYQTAFKTFFISIKKRICIFLHLPDCHTYKVMDLARQTPCYAML